MLYTCIPNSCCEIWLSLSLSRFIGSSGNIIRYCGNAKRQSSIQEENWKIYLKWKFMNCNLTKQPRNWKVIAISDTNLIKQNVCEIHQIEIEFASSLWKRYDDGRQKIDKEKTIKKYKFH